VQSHQGCSIIEAVRRPSGKDIVGDITQPHDLANQGVDSLSGRQVIRTDESEIVEHGGVVEIRASGPVRGTILDQHKSLEVVEDDVNSYQVGGRVEDGGHGGRPGSAAFHLVPGRVPVDASGERGVGEEEGKLADFEEMVAIPLGELGVVDVGVCNCVEGSTCIKCQYGVTSGDTAVI
jgi:hypothetical protein